MLSLIISMLFLAPFKPPVARPVVVYILAGQSNASGFAPASDLPPELTLQPDVLFDDSTYKYQTETFVQAAPNWIPLQPSTLRNGEFFGPEITMGRTLADSDPDVTIAIVRVWVGATVLDVDWLPIAVPAIGKTKAKSEGYAHVELIKRIGEIKARLDASKASKQIPSWRWGGFAWVQGEGDANRSTFPSYQPSARYQANLTNLVSTVRAATHDPKLPVVLNRLSALGGPAYQRPNGVLRFDAAHGGTYSAKADFLNDGIRRGPVPFQQAVENVRAAQDAYAAGDVNSECIDSDNLPFMPLGKYSDFHFDSDGQRTLGIEFANAFMSIRQP